MKPNSAESLGLLPSPILALVAVIAKKRGTVVFSWAQGLRSMVRRRTPGSTRLFQGPFRRKARCLLLRGTEGVGQELATAAVSRKPRGGWHVGAARAPSQLWPQQDQGVRRACGGCAVHGFSVFMGHLSTFLAASCSLERKAPPGTKREYGVSSAWSGAQPSGGFPPLLYPHP